MSSTCFLFKECKMKMRLATRAASSALPDVDNCMQTCCQERYLCCQVGLLHPNRLP